MYQRILLICLSSFIFFGYAVFAGETKGYHFDIHKQLYPLATFFSIQSDDTYHGMVKNSIFRARTNYDLSNKQGWQATGIKRVMSLGSFYPWATEIDVYNTQWDYIGMIDGQVVSTAAARFSIYDANNQLVGIAYLDHSLDTCSIVYPQSEAFPIAVMNRQNEFKGLDWWQVAVYDSQQVDERIVRIFAAMICDLQEAIDAYYAPTEDLLIDD